MKSQWIIEQRADATAFGDSALCRLTAVGAVAWTDSPILPLFCQ